MATWQASIDGEPAGIAGEDQGVEGGCHRPDESLRAARRFVSCVKSHRPLTEEREEMEGGESRKIWVVFQGHPAFGRWASSSSTLRA